jgi:hypothetical protein
VGHRTLDFGRILVLPQTLVNDLTKQVVVRPRQIFDFDYKLGANPVPGPCREGQAGPTGRALDRRSRGARVPQPAIGFKRGCGGGFRESAAADLKDQVDLALGFQRNEVGVLEDFAVDRHRHAFLDLAAEAGYRWSSSSTMRGKLFAGDPRQDQAGAGREPLSPSGGLSRRENADCASRTRWWREKDSNRRSPVRGTTLFETAPFDFRLETCATLEPARRFGVRTIISSKLDIHSPGCSLTRRDAGAC